MFFNFKKHERLRLEIERNLRTEYGVGLDYITACLNELSNNTWDQRNVDKIKETIKILKGE